MSGLVEVARFNWPYQADLARAFLESYGVHALVLGSQSYAYSEGALVGVTLMVPEQELEEAREALREYRP